MIEYCKNCEKGVDWGPVFQKREGKTRKCPYCKKDFDQRIYDSTDEFRLTDFIKPKKR